MATSDYRRTLEEAQRLSSVEQARLIKELAVRLMESGKALDLSRVEDAVAYVERMRGAGSRHRSGRLKTLREFLTELESWEG
jgi:hypothetical protein